MDSHTVTFISSLVVGLTVLSGCMTKPTTLDSPIVIAHRGASGYRPEHTESAYRLAVAQGADFIEPDLVPTRDGELIARHENELGSTTDVAQRTEFRDRYTTKEVDGEAVSGWFSEDFTLAEIKTLRARERIPDTRPDNVRFDGTQEILTLGEIVQLAKELSKTHSRPIGIYPETKHPTYFALEGQHLDGSPINLCTSTMLVAELVQQEFVEPSRVYIQSFEIENLLALKNRIMPAAGVSLPLIQLLGNAQTCESNKSNPFSRPHDVYYHSLSGHDLKEIYGDLTTLLELDADICFGAFNNPAAMAWLSQTVTGIGPWKDNLINPTFSTPDLISHALAADLAVHPFTLRVEQEFRSEPEALSSVEQEMEALLELGVQGFFTDNPDIGAAVRNRWQRQGKSRKTNYKQ